MTKIERSYRDKTNSYLPIVQNPDNFNSEDVLKAIEGLKKILEEISSLDFFTLKNGVFMAIKRFEEMIDCEPLTSAGRWENQHKNLIRSAWN
jgi:hypothetical protein